MFGAFKKLFSKSAQPETVGRPAQSLPSRPAFVPAAAADLAPEAPMVTSAQQAMSTVDAIHIPLTAIVPKLPGHLARLAIKSGLGTLDLPVATALEQLPSGRVRIPFGQLRKGVPSGTFADNETHDEVMIELPLSPILMGMNPALLARKAQKRVEVPDEVVGVFGPQGTISARVAKDIASASAMPANSPAAMAAPPPPEAIPPARPAPAVRTAAPAPAPRATAIPVAAPPTSPAGSPISAPRPAPAAPAPTPIRVPITPKPAAPAPSSPLPFAQRAEALLAQRLPAMGIKPPAPIAPPVTPISPISPIVPEPEAEFEEETEVEAEEPAPPSPAPVAPPSAPSGPIVMPKTPTVGDVVPIPLSDISENWPDPVRQEIAHGEWDMSMVVFPINRLEAGMRSGRISFTWGEIRQWLNPPIGSIHSQQVDVPVELPLKVVAPLFLAARRPTPQKKTDFDETIPDVFTGLEAGAAVKHPPVSARPGNTEMFRNAAAAAIPARPIRTGNTDLFKAPLPPPTPVAPPPAAVSEEPEVEEEEQEEETPAPAAVEAPVAAAPVSSVPRPDALGSIFGLPLKSDWSPAEIAQKVCELSGVSGGVITTADGLLVAGMVEEPQKSETLAAFLPQIFARLNQYAGEMEIGLLTSLNMTTAEAPCAIYKCGKLYLGVVGRIGQTLPDSHLRRIAAEIAKRNP